jgi:hypothetical protein
MEYQPYSAQTPDELEAFAQKYGGACVIRQLSQEDLSRPASKWNARHLPTYRLLIHPEGDFLSVFLSDHEERCPMTTCIADRSCYQKLNHEQTQSLIGDNPGNLGQRTESELMQLRDGFFWVALVRAARPYWAAMTRVYPKRERRPVRKEGFINSSSAIVGSSSPPRHSSSEFEATLGSLDEDEHESRRTIPENITVDLVISFLTYALHLCLEQPCLSGAKEEVRPRTERMRTSTYVAGDTRLTAEDDGGICRMRRLGSDWVMLQPYLALLEAKRGCKHICFDENKGGYIPIVSNENLAQCLGEAVITMKGNPEYIKDE